MMVSGGYPGTYNKGEQITHLESVDKGIVFHAGTIEKDGRILTNGGRVLALTALGESMQEALSVSYQNAEKILFNKKYCRTDIGKDLI